MRIDCQVRKFVGERFLPFVSLTFRSGRYYGPIEALVDTGSPWTVLSTTDALKLNIPITKMRRGRSLSLAGHQFFKHPLKSTTTLRFRAQDDRIVGFDTQIMGVLVPTRKGRKAIEDVRSIPSLIGNDFLEESKLAFFFNPSTKVAYLER